MQKITFKKIIWILFYIFLFLFLLNNSYAYLDPDLGWHLKVGQDILTEKQVPSINYYNYTLSGKKWVDHEWLSNAIIFWLYNNLGYISLNLLFAFIALITLIVLAIFTQKIFLKEKNNIFFIIAFQLIGIFAIAPHLGIRVQEITLLNLLLLLIIIYYYEKNKNYKILFPLPLLFYFWACSHGGFLIGLFILFFWLAVKIFELKINQFKFFQFLDFSNLFNIKNILTPALFSIFALLATLITPYGLKLYSFLSEYKNTYYLAHIQEWLPAWYLPIQYWQLLYCALVVTAVTLLVIFIIQKNKNIPYKISLWQISIILLFLILAFKSKRHFPLLFIVSFPITVALFTSFFTLPNKIDLKKWSKPLLVIKSYLIIGLSIIILSKAININFISSPFTSFCSNFPCQATQFLKENKQYYDLNIFNNFDWGGYLIWLWPEKQLFIDGRLPITEFAGHTLLEEYHEFFKEKKAESKLNQYNISLVLFINIEQEPMVKLNWFEKYFLLVNEKKINTYENHLMNYLEDSQDWREVYQDQISKIYVKI